jgi:hypothetical protein
MLSTTQRCIASVALVAGVALVLHYRASARHSSDGQADRPVLVVDCGSGFTRAKVYWRGRGRRIRTQEPHVYAGLPKRWTQRKIVDALMEGGAKLRDWVTSIQALVHATNSRAALVGATGGLRKAIDDGRVTPAMLLLFKQILAEYAPSASFYLLSGEDEAEAELTAVRHVAEFVLPSQQVGMVSGGGMTCQVGFFDQDQEQATFLSIVAGLSDAAVAMLEGNVSSRVERRRALEKFDAHLAQAVDHTGKRGKLKGTFVVIEMPGGLGSATDYDGHFARLATRIGRRILSKQQLVEALDEQLYQWQQGETAIKDRYSAYAGLLPAELRGLTALMDESSHFYVSREFEMPPGDSIRPDWSLGFVVKSQRL